MLVTCVSRRRCMWPGVWPSGVCEPVHVGRPGRREDDKKLLALALAASEAARSFLEDSRRSVLRCGTPLPPNALCGLLNNLGQLPLLRDVDGDCPLSDHTVQDSLRTCIEQLMVRPAMVADPRCRPWE